MRSYTFLSAPMRVIPFLRFYKISPMDQPKTFHHLKNKKCIDNRKIVGHAGHLGTHL